MDTNGEAFWKFRRRVLLLASLNFPEKMGISLSRDLKDEQEFNMQTKGRAFWVGHCRGKAGSKASPSSNRENLQGALCRRDCPWSQVISPRDPGIPVSPPGNKRISPPQLAVVAFSGKERSPETSLQDPFVFRLAAFTDSMLLAPPRPLTCLPVQDISAELCYFCLEARQGLSTPAQGCWPGPTPLGRPNSC